ncbi:hypothetical protein [Vibrio xiamenensis]|uniref:hypothetical protein n=1 Tax=Vibrio xiamenensis TaxID=861298 RepID=UPI000B8899E9|nr:hypothetical protein [Vibrio xiamenensis]
MSVESIVTQLKKDFYAQLSSLQAYTLPHSQPTLSVLTEEEIRELEHLWVELNIWKKKQSH